MTRHRIAIVGCSAAGSRACSRSPRHAGPNAAVASSHREAPLISEDPAADNTDVYAFVSPDRPDTVTLIANYIPLEEPAGGPNFTSSATTSSTRSTSTTTATARTTITLRVPASRRRPEPGTRSSTTPGRSTRSTTRTGTSGRPTGSRRVDGGGEDVLGENLPTPPVNIGPRSTPTTPLAGGGRHDAAGRRIKVFAGQRDDPFFVDLGSVFDLAGLRPFNPPHLLPLPRSRRRRRGRLQHAHDRDPGSDLELTRDGKSTADDPA